MSLSIGSSFNPATLFSKLDVKGAGFLTKSDLQAINGKSGSSGEVDELFKKLDTNNDGKITQSEFTASLDKMLEQLKNSLTQSRLQGQGVMSPSGAASSPKDLAKQIADDLFAKVSGGGDSFSKDQLKAALKKDGMDASQVDDLFKKLDANNDGKVTKEELASGIQKDIEQGMKNAQADGTAGAMQVVASGSGTISGMGAPSAASGDSAIKSLLDAIASSDGKKGASVIDELVKALQAKGSKKTSADRSQTAAQQALKQLQAYVQSFSNTASLRATA